MEKYREEKAKGVELARRLEDMLKEVNRVKGLERSLDELQEAHLEQNKVLQRLQEEGRKLEKYRQTATWFCFSGIFVLVWPFFFGPFGDSLDDIF